ncbi:hypothetical protein SeLEV6574_g05471 [Synchytrium endobioticum]|nr:hypothetical protein SeLEV6574_g05471 [Synchytrium endobioticum]
MAENEVDNTSTILAGSGIEVSITKIKDDQEAPPSQSLSTSTTPSVANLSSKKQYQQGSQLYDLNNPPQSVKRIEQVAHSLVYWKSPLASSLVFVGLVMTAYAVTSWNLLPHLYFMMASVILVGGGGRLLLNAMQNGLGVTMNVDATVEEVARKGVINRERLERVGGDVADMINWGLGRVLLMTNARPWHVLMTVPPLMIFYYLRITFFWSFVLGVSSVFLGPILYNLVVENFGDKVEGVEHRLRNLYDEGVQKTREVAVKVQQKIQEYTPTKVKEERIKKEE